MVKNPTTMLSMARHALGMRIAVPLDALRWFIANTPPSKKAPQDVTITPRPPAIATPWTVPPPGPASWQLTLYELSGAPRARDDYALAPPITLAAARGSGASLVVQSGPGLRDVLVLDPRRGDPVRRAQLPDDAVPGLAFAALVDGRPLAGTILAAPLRVVLF